MPSDEELIATYLAGDEHTFATLVDRHLAGVYSFARRFVGSERDAEDIAQETFLKVWKNIKTYSSTNARFKTWLMRIARNTAVDFLRKRRDIPFSRFQTEENEQPFEYVPDETLTPVELAALAGDERALTEAVAKLSPAHREIILLYYGVDRTFDEVAAITGESVNTVKSRHRRAVAALRVLLAPN